MPSSGRTIAAALAMLAASEARGGRKLPPLPPAEPAGPVRRTPRPGRNELCGCGSGRKYKRCCLGR